MNGTNATRCGLVWGVALATAAVAAAQDDRVRTLGGAETGMVVASSRDEVTLERDGQRSTIAVDQIRSVLFADEPSTLTQARINFEAGGYQNVLETLDRIDATAINRPLIRQDIDYYSAASAVRLAIAGRGDATAAGRALSRFARANGDSYHYYEAVETMGDLLTSLGRVEQAVKTYDRLAETESRALRVRGALSAAGALQAAAKHPAAIERFDAALAIAPVNRDATLGRAVSVAATGDLDGALRVVRETIRSAGDGDDVTRAAAYNALGRCYNGAGRSTDALLAYLHTDLLFPGHPPTHAEALYHLTSLWRRAGKPDDADDAAAKLRRRYGATPWASRIGRDGE